MHSYIQYTVSRRNTPFDTFGKRNHIFIKKKISRTIKYYVSISRNDAGHPPATNNVETRNSGCATGPPASPLHKSPLHRHTLDVSFCSGPVTWKQPARLTPVGPEHPRTDSGPVATFTHHADRLDGQWNTCCRRCRSLAYDQNAPPSVRLSL